MSYKNYVNQERSVAVEAKRAGKTEVLSLRVDPKTRFLLDVLTRLRGQSISTVVERAIQEAADNARWGDEGNASWRDVWHVNDGVRFLKLVGNHELFPSYDDEYILDFAKTHWPFFYTSSNCREYKEWSIEIIWPRLDEFIEIWSKTKSTDYFAAGKAMQKAVSSAGVKAPDWPIQTATTPRVEKTTSRADKGGGPDWKAPWEEDPPPKPKGDLDDEIPF